MKNTCSRSYYRKFYRLVAVAVALLTAVLTGSLVLGDSVRGSLTERVNERLGNAETLILTGTGFLSDSILDSPLMEGAQGYLLAEGFVASEGQMIPVNVWGSDMDSLNRGEVVINEELAKVHSSLFIAHSYSPIVLHLPSNSLVGSGSLFVSQSYATQLRLTVKGVKSKEEGGNLLLRQEQVRPKNIFMNRRELAEALGVEGKINVIMSAEQISEAQFAGSIWKPEYSGLQIHDNLYDLRIYNLQFGCTPHIVGTDRVFLPQGVVEALAPSAGGDGGAHTARYLAYFVNSLGPLPYSFVTATDQLHGDETILTDYAAKRMNACMGDTVVMEYYVARDGLKRLETRSHRFRVSGVVPIGEFQRRAELLTADFPGLSGVSRCTDWDSDLPIDMSRVTRADEDYWAEYRQTPKALVSLDAVGKDWTGSYGVATKIVTNSPASSLRPQNFGIAVVQPREAAIRAAQNGTDFGLLFLALGFFIIVAAILLMQNPLAEMYQLRRHELQLFSVMGFSRVKVFRRLLSEALPVVLMASPAGVLLGYAYAAVILWLLAGPWSGATHTDGFGLHVRAATVAIALVVAVLLALLVLCLAVRSGIKHSQGGRGRRATPHPRPLPLQGRGEQRSQGWGEPLLTSSLYYYRRQHWLSFWTLALGVFIVFAVGLNRPDFSHSSGAVTGGRQFYGESRIPIQYDLNTPEGRHHLHLDDLPVETRFLQLPKHTEDEASCLNLNKVETPSVIGMAHEDMKAFGIVDDQQQRADIVPVFADEEALLWSMMKQVGDTLNYHASDGREVKAVIAGSYPTGIFHGNVVMPLSAFRQLWPEETGSRILLFSLPSPHDSASGSSATLPIAQALSDYGVTIIPTTERMRQFFEVTDTYLTIFLSLGGLGLLLGLASLLIVIRKNLAARRSEILLYHTLGFTSEAVARMLRREQLVVPLLAVGAAMAGSYAVSFLIPITAYLFTPTAIVLLLLMLAFTWMIIHISINPKSIKQCETY